MLGGLTKKPLLLLALAAGAYYLWNSSKQTPAQVAAGAASNLNFSDPLSFLNSAANAAGTIAKAASGASGMGMGNLPSELRGIDGMAPAGLGECMAGLGAYGDLGGSFYGGY